MIGWRKSNTPDFIDKAAVLCSRIARGHPLPDGNKRTAFLALIELIERNGHEWTESERDPDESVAVLEAVAAAH